MRSSRQVEVAAVDAQGRSANDHYQIAQEHQKRASTASCISLLFDIPGLVLTLASHRSLTASVFEDGGGNSAMFYSGYALVLLGLGTLGYAGKKIYDAHKAITVGNTLSGAQISLFSLSSATIINPVPLLDEAQASSESYQNRV